MINRISEIEVPMVLYKYRDWSNKFHRRLISDQEIYFASPSEFNDPFDGNIPVRWDLMTYDDCFEKNVEILNIVHNDKDQQILREYAKEITDSKTLWHPDRLVKERPEQLEKWNSIIGLFSLSSVPDNILMWSHYSLNHTGFVVGLDTQSLINDNNFDYLEPVNYQTTYPIISGLDDTTVQFYKKFFCKSTLWNYEMEWRVSKNHILGRVVKLNPRTICQIIIGCCTNITETKNIIKQTKNYLRNNVQIFKAEKAASDFGLILNRIE